MSHGTVEGMSVPGMGMNECKKSRSKSRSMLGIYIGQAPSRIIWVESNLEFLYKEQRQSVRKSVGKIQYLGLITVSHHYICYAQKGCGEISCRNKRQRGMGREGCLVGICPLSEGYSMPADNLQGQNQWLYTWPLFSPPFEISWQCSLLAQTRLMPPLMKSI